MKTVLFKCFGLLLLLLSLSCKSDDFSPTPAIVSVQPNAASPEESILLLGGNFSETPSENIVTFGGVEATVTESTKNSASVNVPVGGLDGFITISVNGITATSISKFDVLDELTITSIFPSEAKSLDTITVNGLYFDTEIIKNKLTFSNVEGEVLSATTRKIRAVVPAGAQIGPQEVVLNARNQTANFTGFKVSAAPPFYFTAIANSTISETLNKVSMIDSKNAFAVGSDGKVLKTIDGGETWGEITNVNQTTLRDVHAFDTNSVVVCGSSGLVMKTSDNGTTWNTVDVGTTERLRRLYFLNATTGWMVGSGGLIFKTIDGGNSWINQVSTTTISLYGVYFVDQQNGWVVGNDDLLLKTTDGGSTWSQVVLATGEDLTSVIFKDAQTGWITGDNNVLLATTDGGATWVNQNIVLADSGDDINDITLIGNVIIAVADDRQMIRSEDGGTSWVVLDRGDDISPSIYHLEGIDSSQNTAFAVGQSGVIIK